MEIPTSPLSSLPATSSPPALEIRDDHATRRPARTDEEKLELVSEYMRNELRWGITEYLKSVMESSKAGSPNQRVAFARFAYEDPKALQFYLGSEESITVKQRCSREHIMRHTKCGAASIREEIKKLATTKPFHKSQVSGSDGFERMNISSIIEEVETTCPLFLSLLRTILQPLRNGSATDDEEGATVNQNYLIVTIIAIVCRAARSIESSGFQLQLSVYLHSKGIKRRQLEALSQLGLCCSYRTTMRAIKKKNEESARRVAAQGNSPSVVTAYDNFEQMEHVKEQRLDNQSSFRSVTTGQCIQGIEMPPGGLQQSMLHSSVELQLKDIFFSAGNQADTIENEISQYFVYTSIQAAFPGSVTKEDPPVMPVIDLLPRQKTTHSSLGAIPHDESTNVGNLEVLSCIFKDQYKLPDEMFNERLYLIYGDQKTTQRIRTIKSRRTKSIRAVDRLDWVLPVPALFHLRMNYLYMLNRVHFGALDDGSLATLHHAMNMWTRKGISRTNANFHALEQLVIHSFQSRVCALLWNKLGDVRLGSTREDIDRILCTYDSVRLHSLIREVVNCYEQESQYIINLEARNHILFLQHAQTYLLLKYAIKHADLGLILRAIRRSSVYFHASGQHKYAYEMLYLLRLVCTDASSPELQRAVLANGLVNTSGAEDSWFETDRLVEFHNGTLKTLFRDRRGSAMTVQYLMEKCALNTEFYQSLDNNITEFLQHAANGKHPQKDASLDIQAMAEKLFRSGSIAGTQGNSVSHEAIDLFEVALPRLAGDCLCKFNIKECRDLQDIDLNDIDEEAIEDIDTFFEDKNEQD